MNRENNRPRTARGSHIALYVLLATVFAYAVAERYRRPLDTGYQIPVESERIAAVETRIDPNTANWAELARLPEVGEALAREIVFYREETREKRRSNPSSGASEFSDDVIFRYIQDLDPIPGIGEKTLERIAPYLKFPDGK